MKQDSMLVKVEPPDKDRSPLTVAGELISLIRKEYKYNIYTLTKLFHCDRQWVEDFIVPNVKHIQIHHFFMSYILDNFSERLSEQEVDLMRKGHYFISEPELERFWNEEADAHRKTEMTDVYSLLRRPDESGLLSEEKREHFSTAPSKQEKARHLDRMECLLTESGYQLYKDSYSAKNFIWEDAPLPPLFGSGFVVPSQIAAEQHISNNTARIKLALSGATKITFGGKTLWTKPKQQEGWKIPTQYHKK